MNDSSINTSPSTRRLRWFVRWPLKWLAFLIVVFFVCFPYPAQFLRHVRHVSNYDAMIDPDHPLMAQWEAGLRAQWARELMPQKSNEPVLKSKTNAGVSGHAPGLELSDWAAFDVRDHWKPQVVQKKVERFIYERVPYAWDWDLWGSADYMPTVEEMYQQSLRDADGKLREDCDGRAVLAASLLRRLGYQSKLVTDLRHVWVTTPAGELMGPGRAKTMVSTDKGNRLNIWQSLGNVPVSLSYGVAVFPLWRELIILLAAFLLLIPRDGRKLWLLVGLQLMLLGLLLVRGGYLDPSSLSQSVRVWPVYVGLVVTLEGMLITALAARRCSDAVTATVAQS